MDLMIIVKDSGPNKSKNICLDNVTDILLDNFGCLGRGKYFVFFKDKTKKGTEYPNLCIKASDIMAMDIFE